MSCSFVFSRAWKLQHQHQQQEGLWASRHDRGDPMWPTRCGPNLKLKLLRSLSGTDTGTSRFETGTSATCVHLTVRCQCLWMARRCNLRLGTVTVAWSCSLRCELPMKGWIGWISSKGCRIFRKTITGMFASFQQLLRYVVGSQELILNQLSGRSVSTRILERLWYTSWFSYYAKWLWSCPSSKLESHVFPHWGPQLDTRTSTRVLQPTGSRPCRLVDQRWIRSWPLWVTSGHSHAQRAPAMSSFNQ